LIDRQQETPLFTALLQHAARDPIQFHIPGHKKGQGVASDFRAYIGMNAFAIDLVNIAPLDDLHHPKTIIHAAQCLAAEAFGAEHTYFNVQGTSGAIMTMVMSVCGPGDKIVVPRNVHKSVLTAIVLSGAHPIFMHPEIDTRVGIAHNVSVETVRHTLEWHPDAKALLLINPTYFGMSTDLETIVALAHVRNIPVLVDEAHGAHIHFHPQLAKSAMQAGADMAATSIHKLGGSMTQSSILNVQGALVNPGHVQSILSMLTTTSTSYLLLASLDTARKQLAIKGQELLEQAIELSRWARQRLNEMDGLYCFGEEIVGHSSTFALDPTKLTVTVKDLGLSGHDVEVLLRTDYNIEVELSDLYNVLCVVSFGDTKANILALVNAFSEISANYYQGSATKSVRVKMASMPLLAMLPRDAFYAPTELVPIEQAVGRTIAEFVTVYPPGIPIFMPGEVVTADNIDYLREHIEEGLPVLGPDDPTIERVRVVRQFPDSNG